MKTIARVILSETATSNLKQIASRTGLSPNLIARFAMLCSFEQDNEPAEDTGSPGLTILQQSLFGELEGFLLAAFSSRCPNGVSDSQRSRLLAAHIARGAAYLNVRVAAIADLARMVTT